MPRQEILSPAQRAQLLALPADARRVAELYTFSPADLDLIAKRRGEPNRLGFAIQLGFLRHPGRAWTPDESVPVPMLRYIAGQLGITPDRMAEYAARDETRREHLAELLAVLGWRTFGLPEHREMSAWLHALARGTDRGLALIEALLDELRQRRVLAPDLSVLDRLASAVRHRARREAYRALTADLSPEQRARLDDLLAPYPDSKLTHLGRLRRAGGAPNPANILKAVERLAVLRGLGIPAGWASRVHQNRLAQTAREGASTDAAHLREFGDERRHATLVAVVLDTTAALTDETLEMHGRAVGREFKKAERRHRDAFQESGKAINEKVRLYAAVGKALIEARTKAIDPFPEIEKLMPWGAFLASVEAAARLAGPEDFDHLALVGKGYPYIRRYAPEFLDAFEFRAAPAGAELLKAIGLLRDLNARNARAVPKDAPTGFVRRRWRPHVFTGEEIDRGFYELCVLSELRNALRSGDLWVVGSRQFKDFEEYLLPPQALAAMKPEGLPLAVGTGCRDYLDHRGSQLHEALTVVNGLAERGELPDACPGTSLTRLSRVADWHVRDETYSKGLAEVVNYHRQQPFAEHWGEGTTSSSDGQRFRAGGVGEARGEVNARYGNDPGATFYTNVSDQYSPFHTKVINATVRDATHVLDGLLYHESDLRIEEHYTDTGGFTDHVFALCHLLGYRFAPRIRDLADKRLAVIEKPNQYPALEGLIGTALNTKRITAHWDEVLRLATSIRQGTVTASLMLRKLGAYPRQNGLALALRELGRLERSLFTLAYLKDIELRRRIHVGLNKGEARNALARAVFFNRLGELRDRTYENQRHRASGLNLVVAAIVLWNTVYIERVVKSLRERGQAISDDSLAHLSPLGWEHINLTGDYVWKPEGGTRKRPLRQLRLPIAADEPGP